MKTIARTLLAGLVTLVLSQSTGCAALVGDQPTTNQAILHRWNPGPGMPERHLCVGVATEDCYDRFPNHDALLACLEAQVGECESKGGVRVASYQARVNDR